jgi:uncharacterized protein DUF1801
MAKNKTTQTESSVLEFINNIPDEKKRDDSLRITEIFKKASGFEPKMWGPSIIGFGSYHYKYESGREGDAPLAGFSPRKDSFSLYFSSSFKSRDELLKKFGKHKTAKACVYIKKLEDIDTDILGQMIKGSMSHIQEKYPD